MTLDDDPDRPGDSGRDRRLAALLATLTDSSHLGGAPDFDAIRADDPAMADELIELWGAARVADELAESWTDEATLDLGSDPARHPEAPRSGSLIGDCELIEELGRGGMGVVYRARQRGLGRMVALKLLRSGLIGPEEARRFQLESRALAGLDHPNIVPIFEGGTHEGVPYLLMRLVEGTTLARRLADDGPLPPHRAAALMATVCRAVAYAHDRGMLHRDLKPSNILIDGEGRPYVADFGLAKRVGVDSDLTASGAIVGTPGYLAPEQAAADRGQVGPSSDVHALGATLYQAITGRPPFLAATASETIQLVLDEDPLPPRALNPRIDPDLESIALKCLQKRPELRYPTAGALAEDLEGYLAGEPVSARSASLRALAGRFLGETHHAAILERWGLLWVAHAAAIVVFYGVATALLWAGVRARWPQFLLFSVGLGAWAAIFWGLRRRGGPIRFVERQVAHIWAGGVAGLNLTLLTEALLGLPVWTLAPTLAIQGGILFLAKAGVLSGTFYLYAIAEFLAVAPMALLPAFALPIHAAITAACFTAEGLKHHRRRNRRRAAS